MDGAVGACCSCVAMLLEQVGGVPAWQLSAPTLTMADTSGMPCFTASP